MNESALEAIDSIVGLKLDEEKPNAVDLPVTLSVRAVTVRVGRAHEDVARNRVRSVRSSQCFVVG